MTRGPEASVGTFEADRPSTENWPTFTPREGTVWAVDRRTITYPFERAIAYWKTNFFLWGITSELPVQKGTAWTKGLGGTLMHGPAAAHDTVYAATVEGRVWALDAESGEVRWSTQPGAGISSGITVAGDTVVLGTEDGRLLGLNAHTGEQQWDFGLGGRISSRPVAVDGKLYLTSEDGKVYAVSGVDRRLSAASPLPLVTRTQDRWSRDGGGGHETGGRCCIHGLARSKAADAARTVLLTAPLPDDVKADGQSIGGEAGRGRWRRHARWAFIG